MRTSRFDLKTLPAAMPTTTAEAVPSTTSGAVPTTAGSAGGGGRRTHWDWDTAEVNLPANTIPTLTGLSLMRCTMACRSVGDFGLELR